MANISSIKLPNGTTYNLKDNGALQLTGGTVTGPTIFENSVDIDEATVGDLVATGAVTFTNYPTTIATSSGTNQLTLISNTKYVLTTPGGSFIFTTPVDNDTKVSTAAVTSGTTYYPVVGANTTSAATKFYDSTGINYTATNGTANGSNGAAVLVLGNNIASSTANWKAGKISLYGTTAYATTIVSGAPSAARTITLPNKDGTVALTSDLTWGSMSGKPTATGSSTTGISIAAHGTGTVIGVQSTTTTASKASGANGTAPTLGTAISIIGVQSTTTTASKVTVGSHSTDYGVKSAGSASTWTFEEKTIPNVTSAGSASSWTFEEKTIPNVTAAGSGSASLTFAMDTTDTKKLKITFSHTHTAPTIGTAIKVQSKSGGSNGTAPTLGTAIKVQSKSGGANSTAPTLGSKVPTVSASDVTVPIKNASATSIPNVTSAGSASTWSFTDVTVPIKNASASTFVTGTTHTVTDNGHTHSIG